MNTQPVPNYNPEDERYQRLKTLAFKDGNNQRITRKTNDKNRVLKNQKKKRRKKNKNSKKSRKRNRK